MKEKNKEIATFKIAQELGGLELLDAKYEKQNFSQKFYFYLTYFMIKI